MPECLNKIIEYGFEELGLTKIYGAYFDGNIRSKRVLEKCNSKYYYTLQNVPCAIKGVFRTEYVMFIMNERKMKTSDHIVTK